MADLILYKGKLYTQDRSQPQASAVALHGNTILAVGDDDEINNLAHPHTRRINLEGRAVLPALSDAHFHFYSWSLSRRNLALASARSLDELLQALKERVASTQAGRWIQGQGWDEIEWSNPTMPTCHDLDRVSPNHPVILWRHDLHTAVVNSKALALAGITTTTPDPPDGVIERDQKGAPTGILKELAINLVRDLITEPTDEEIDQTMVEGIAALHQLGYTGLHDQRLMAGSEGPAARRAYQRLYQAGKLKLRICTNIHYSRLEQALELGLRSGFGNDCLRLGFVKMFTDGSMGARTAWQLEPYTGGGTGMNVTPLETMAEVARLAHTNGWALSVHAIGDRANRAILDILASLPPDQHTASMPHRIEHVQLLHPADQPRLARLGVTASVQPIHLTDDVVMMDRICGARGRYGFPFRSLKQSGAVLAFGSDAPVSDPDPWLGIHAAVNRCRTSGYPSGGWYAEQGLSLEEAVWAYTMGNASAIGQQHRQGSLSAGKLADLIVLERDVFTVDPMTLADTRVVMTIFNGTVVYEG